MKTLTVIIPVFNEEKTVTESLSKLSKLQIFQKALIINDGSTDNSKKLINDFIQKDSRFEYIESSRNLGKGNALALAQNNIHTDFVIIHDADLEYNPEDIVSLFEKAYDSDSLVIGSRFIGDKIRKTIYNRTYFANRIMSLFFSFVYGLKCTDIATCYKLMPVDYFKSIEIKENGFSIEIELLAKFVKENKKIIEVPISYFGRSYEDGKKIKTIDGFKYLYNTLKYRFFN